MLTKALTFGCIEGLHVVRAVGVDGVYGDTFSIRGMSVENILANVRKLSTSM